MLGADFKKHAEPNSGIPVAKPTRLRVPTQTDRIMNMLRLEQMRAREDQEFETFEESEDFDLDDGETWVSPYEEVFDAEPFAEAPTPAPPAPAPQPPPVGDSPQNVPRADP